jgi:ATP-dependent DNA helicase RecG
LASLGIRSVADLVHYFPRAWEDRSRLTDLNLPTATGEVVVKGRVLRASQIKVRPTLALFKAQLVTPTGPVWVSWFKRQSRRYDALAALKKDIVPGVEVWIVGKSDPRIPRIREIRAEDYYLAQSPDALIHVGRIVPVYPLTEGLTQKFMRELVHQALEEGAAALEEILPRDLLVQRGLLAIGQAAYGIHFPRSQAELEAARLRWAYEELLLLSFAWILKRRQIRSVVKGFNYEVKRSLLTPFRQHLGFELTAAQKRVINEIFSDMEKPYPMTRLLQGDVGAGKTVVALSALLLAVENGGQGAFMAPTEILADQHGSTMRRVLKNLPVKFAVLSAGVPKAEREKIRSAASLGEIDILVGTHALLEEGVAIPNLRLAVIDEQHRFGVRQRASLRGKNSTIDLLVMTATPIPRTLALTLFGDLDISTLDQLPPGRGTVQTIIASEREALATLKSEVARGHQGYIVYPVIEESQRADLQSAKKEFARLSATALSGLKVALLHGAMPSAARTKVMNEFSSGRLDVLVATSIVEVGLDVPNATVMIIQNAERFGLATLHQLRGRIGRREKDSHCFVVTQAKTPQSLQRIEAFARIKDGFALSEEDLKLRGPGEVVGTAQHGEISLAVADLVKDAALLEDARKDAEELLAKDPHLAKPEDKGLRRRLTQLYKGRWEWIDFS